MHYCIKCYHPNPEDLKSCEVCSTPLLLADSFHLTHLLQNLSLAELRKHPRRYPTVTFEAKDEHMGTFRVIKVLQSEEPDAIDRFQRELEVLRTLQHPGIPRKAWTFSAPIAGDRSRRCLVMERVEGKNLKVWIEQQGTIDQAQAIDWLKQLLAIVDVLHQSYWMHRDIKPENVMVRPTRQLVLVDFGVARSVTRTLVQKRNRGKSITRVGTFGYSPLEQFQGEGDFRADFFAMAQTIVYALTGKDPLELRQNGQSVWRKHAKVSVGFADLLDQLMLENPHDRLTDIQDILWQLDHLRLIRMLQLVRAKSIRWVAASAIVFGTVGYRVIPSLSYQNLLRQGNAALQQGSFEQAEKTFRAGLNYRYDLAMLNGLALACDKQGRRQCAAEYYGEALKFTETADPLSLKILHYNVGLNFDRSRQFAQAEQHYRTSIKLGHLDGLVRNNLSRIILVQYVYGQDGAQERLEEARSLATEGLAFIGQDLGMKVALLKNRGWANYRLQNYRQAEADLRRAIELKPDFADAYYLLAQVYEAKNQEQDALIYWTKGLELTLQVLPPEDFVERIQWHNEAGRRISR